MNKPPFQLTQKMVSLCSNISELLGRYEGINRPVPQPQLRRQNRIKTIHSSLAIEGNTLSQDQVSAIIDNKPVVGSVKDITEVKNAIAVYDSIASFDPMREKDFLRAHNMLMQGLIDDPGKYRLGNVGVFKEKAVVHVAPKAALVPKLMDDLFQFLVKDNETHPFIKSCVFHYEFEFIHPFMDGNGRMGRLWQTVLLAHYNSVFGYIPIESIVKKKQEMYYRMLAKSDEEGQSTLFIEFMLEIVFEATKDFIEQIKPKKLTTQERIASAHIHFKQKFFSRKDYIAFQKTLSSATASRDLAFAVEHNLLLMQGDKSQARYQFME